MINSDLIYGSILLAITPFLYGLAYYFYVNRETNKALILVIIAGFLLRLFCCTDPMLHQWDERYHALVAKHLVETPLTPTLYENPILAFDYKDWTSNSIWLHKQPFSLWMIASSFKIFGISELTLRLPSLLFSTLTILIAFLVGKNLFENSIGVLTAFFCSINGLVIELASGRETTDHVDTCYLFLITATILFIVLNYKKQERRYLIGAGIFCGFAILTKWLPAIIVFPLYIVLNYDKKALEILKDLSIILGFTLLIAVPWQLYAFSSYPKEFLWEQHYNNLHFTKGLEGHGQPWWYFLNMIRMTVNELIYLVLVWLLVRSNYSKKIVFIIAWIFIPLIIFSFAQTKMQGYILFTFPAYFIAIALFIEFLKEKIKEGKSKQIAFGYKLLIFAFFVLAVRYGIERIKPFDSKEIANAVKAEITNLYFPPKSILFNAECPIEIMFYKDCLAYEVIPKIELQQKLMNDGYTLYIVDDGKLSSDINLSENIQRIKMDKME